MTEEVMADIFGHVENVVRTMPLRVAQELRDANPVDTKHSGNNWIISVGQRFTGVDGTRQAPSDTLQVKSMADISGYKIADGTVHVTNNVYYVFWLDLGWSPQASAGWIQRGIENGLKRAVEETSK